MKVTNGGANRINSKYDISVCIINVCIAPEVEIVPTGNKKITPNYTQQIHRNSILR